MHWYQIFNKGLWKQSDGTSVAYHHVILPSKFIGKSLLKRLHLEMSSGFLFRRFIPLFVAISNFSFNQRLHLSIARFTEAYFCTIFLSNFCVVFFADLRFHTFFESSVSFLYCSLLNDFLWLVNRFLKMVTTNLVNFFVIIKFILVQTGVINNIFSLAFLLMP